MNKETVKKIHETILSNKEKFLALSYKIWKHPELGFEEKFACAKQLELLKELGFETVSPFGGLETAYRASRGNKRPTFCFVAEYDALPGLGHGCAHNLICVAAIAAGWALSMLLEETKTDGSVVVMGTPGEESKGGKVIMLKNNVLDDIDAVMMAHPSWRTLGDPGCTAIRRFDISFKGKAAHAAASPELGLNALDAATLLFNGVNAWRQQLPESARVHGVILEGGQVPNIIPDHAKCRFFLRSANDDFLDVMEKRFRDIVQGASLMAGTPATVEMVGFPYKSRKPNPVLNRIFVAAAEELGMNPIIPEHPGRGSTDFGDFSSARPGLHPYFGIADREIAVHSVDFEQAAGTDYAMSQMLKAASAMVVTGYEFLSDKRFREEVVTCKRI